MAQGIQAGSLYYTVGIDRASLQRVKAEIQQFGKVSKQASGGARKTSTALKELSTRSRELANRLRTLQSEMKESGGSSEQYRAGFEKVHNEATQLRGALNSLKGSIGSTSAEQAEFHGVMARTASVLQKSAAVTGSARTQYDALGSTFQSTSNDIDKLASQLVQLEHRHDAGRVSTKEYAAQLKVIGTSASTYEARLQELSNQLNLTSTQQARLNKVMQRSTGIQARVSKRATAATGKFNSMATATKLSYGATTLLNDRIFQLSPALGILTNQLIFTTEGLKAFLFAAAPIVAVGGAIVGVIYGIAKSLGAGVGLEAALADVRKTTNLTDSELRQITTTFQELSHEIPVTVDELLETARVAGQLGIRGTENIEQFTEAIANLGVATDVTGEQGATSLARFLSATDTALEDMGDEAIRVSNVLNALENSTAATAKEILEMTTFTQGLGAQAGFTKAEILGMNAALRSVGVRPQAGSAVLRTISDIQTAATEGGEALEAFAGASSVTLEEFEELARNSPVDAFMRLAEGMNQSANAGANLNDMLAEIGVVEVRERRALLGLVEGYERLEGAMSEARAQAILQNSIQEEVTIQSGTTAAKLRLLGNRFVSMTQNIGEKLNPRLEDLIDILIKLTDNLDLLAGALTGSLLALSGPSILRGIGAAATALRGLGATVVTVTTTLWGMQYALVALRGSLAALVSGPLAIGVLGAAIGVGFVTMVRRGKEAVWDADEALEDYTERTRNAIQMFERVRTKNDLRIAMEAVGETLTGPGRDAWDKYKDKIIENIDKVEDLEEATKDVIANFLDIDLSSFESRFTSTMNTLAETVTEATTGPLREELSGLNLDPENLEGTLRSVRQLQEDMSSRDLVPGRVGTLTRDEVEALQELESGLLSAIEARNALREANEEYETSLQLLGLDDGGDGGGGEGGGAIDLEEYRARLAEIGSQRREAVNLINRNFETGLIETDEERNRQLLAAYESAINDYNELYLELQSLQGGGQGLNDLLYEVGFQADFEMNDLERIRGYLESLRQDPVDPLTLGNAENAEELFRALREEGTKLAGAPPSLTEESIEGRMSLIRSALERALDIEDITDEQVQYLQRRLDELRLRLDLETGEVPEFLEEGMEPGDVPGPEEEPATEEEFWAEQRVKVNNKARAAMRQSMIDWRAEQAQLEEEAEKERLARQEYYEDLRLQAASEARAQMRQSNIEWWEQQAQIEESKRLLRLEAQLASQQKQILADREARKDRLEEQEYWAELRQGADDDARAQMRQSWVDWWDEQERLEEEREQEKLERKEYFNDLRLQADSKGRAQMRQSMLDWREEQEQIEESLRNQRLDAEGEHVQDQIAQARRANEIRNNLAEELADVRFRAEIEGLSELETQNELLEAHRRHVEAVADEYGEASWQFEQAVSNMRKLEGAIKRLQERIEQFQGSAGGNLANTIDYTDQVVRRAVVGATGFSEAWQMYNENVGPVTAEVMEVLVEMFGGVNEEVLESVEVLSEMSSMFGDIADSTDNLVSKLAEFASSATEGVGSVIEGISNFSEEADLLDEANEGAWGTVMGGITTVMGGLDSLLPQYDSAANQMVEGAFAAGGAIAEIAIPIPGIGKAISALGSVVSSVLGDMANGAKAVREALDEAAEGADLLTKATTQSFKEIEGVVERVSRGGVLGAWGFKKDELQQEMFDMVMGIAEGAASALESSLASAIEAAMSGEKDWKQAFENNFEDAILNIIMETFIKAQILGAEFQEFIQEFTEILAEEGPEAAFEYLDDNVDEVLDNAKESVDKWNEYVGDRFKEGGNEATQALFDAVEDAESIINQSMARMFVSTATDEDGAINQEMINRMIELAEGVAGGMEQGLRQGINAFLRGDDDWAQQLEDGIKSAVTNALINAFIASAAVQGVMADFVGKFVEIFEESPQRAADFAAENIDATINKISSMIEAFAGSIQGELLPSTNPRSPSYDPPEREPREPREPDPRAAGTQISEITGPTRDLLVDLLRPLAIMPSWTSMIRDIRNDVRMIATNGGVGMPQIQASPGATRAGITNNTVNIQNATINTQATDAKGLWRAISRYSFKEKRGGK